jgi:hypothetical protein
MRIILAGAAGALILSLAGCGEGSAFDNGVRSQFHDTAVQSCISSSRTAPATVRMDWPRLCGCAIERYMANKSTSELRRADPSDPALRAVTQQCALEQVNAAAGGGAKPGQ